MAHMASTTAPPPTVGFDLDMTLIDSRPGIHACYLALSERTGTYIDADLAITRLGPPLAEELINWFPQEQLAETADLYRSMYPTIAIAATPARRGAREAEALSVAVATGPCSAEELGTAGADVVLGDLTEFPAWLAAYRPARA